MKRREFIAGTAATAALSFAQPACAQTNARSTGVKRLAIFHPTRPPEEQTRDQQPSYKAYFDELNRLGYIEGQNLIVERYSAFGQPSRIADAAREIVASRPDVVWPWSGPLMKEIMALTTSIPMVGTTADPVAFGLSSSLARPDKNFTGVVLDAGLEIWAKRVQLLLEVARKVTKVGYLDANPTSFTPGPLGAYIREAAQRVGVAAAFVLVAGRIDRAAYERVWPTLIVGGEKVDRTTFEETFDAINKEGVDGLIVAEAAELVAYRQLIADVAARFRVPAIYTYREYVEVGGLMAYAVNTVDMMRRVANMTSQVLGGANVSDLPFYRQTKYELVLNQKAARSLGLEFSPALLATADAVIE